MLAIDFERVKETGTQVEISNGFALLIGQICKLRLNLMLSGSNSSAPKTPKSFRKLQNHLAWYSVSFSGSWLKSSLSSFKVKARHSATCSSLPSNSLVMGFALAWLSQPGVRFSTGSWRFVGSALQALSAEIGARIPGLSVPLVAERRSQASRKIRFPNFACHWRA